jgi:flagellar motor switch protein FliN
MLELAKAAAAPQLVELPPVTDRKASSTPVFSAHLGLINGIKVRLSASLGTVTMTVAEITSLKDGAVIKLDRGVNEPVDIVLEGQVIARGRLVAVDDSFGVSITEISPSPRT